MYTHTQIRNPPTPHTRHSGIPFLLRKVAVESRRRGSVPMAMADAMPLSFSLWHRALGPLALSTRAVDMTREEEIDVPSLLTSGAKRLAILRGHLKSASNFASRSLEAVTTSAEIAPKFSKIVTSRGFTSHEGLEVFYRRRTKGYHLANSMESFERQWASKLYTSLMVVFLLSTFTCACPQVHSASSDGSDVYKRLEGYGFPEGLLPHIVTGYTFEPSGRFALYLESKCQVLVEHKYPLIYNNVITGTLSYGKLQGLRGITVKAYYIWWNIYGIALGDDESLFFDIGILSTKFPCNNFDDPPICEVHSSVQGAFMDSLSFDNFI